MVQLEGAQGWSSVLRSIFQFLALAAQLKLCSILLKRSTIHVLRLAISISCSEQKDQQLPMYYREVAHSKLSLCQSPLDIIEILKPRTPGDPTSWAWADGPTAPHVYTCVQATPTSVVLLCCRNGWQKSYILRVQMRWELPCRAPQSLLLIAFHRFWAETFCATAFVAKNINSCSGDPGKNCNTGRVNYQLKLWGHCSSKDNLQRMKHRAIFSPSGWKKETWNIGAVSLFSVLGWLSHLDVFLHSVSKNQDELTFCFSTMSSQKRSWDSSGWSGQILCFL